MNLQQYLELFGSSDATEHPTGSILSELEYLIDDILPPCGSDVTMTFAERKAILAELVQRLEEPAPMDTPSDSSGFEPNFQPWSLKELFSTPGLAAVGAGIDTNQFSVTLAKLSVPPEEATRAMSKLGVTPNANIVEYPPGYLIRYSPHSIE